MTHITYDLADLSLNAEGHANAPKESGYDMACCGVSALMFSLVAALNHYEIEAEIFCDDGRIWIRANKEELPGVSQVICDTIASGLALVADKYPEYVSFEVR